MKAQNDLAIEISGLQKSYGQNKAVDGISFSISKGEIFGMLGPNGAGKSTTVEILVGLLQKNGGEVRVLGLDPEKEPNQVKTRIGVQLQTAFLFPRLKVLEVMKLFASFYPRHLDIEQIIERVGLGEKRNAKVRELSGGQLKRLTVAIAMLNDGDIVFLDEPTSGLDPQSRRFLWDAVKELKDKGKTVFLTTHYMDEAQKLCDRVAIIDKGKVIAIGSPEKLIEDNFK
ncbi:MAG: ABC transporter ATP-binding protein, partial [Oscillospiraceae bacterium]|nr:ABC transporter ATP-binding protein [Oscillospiraceae bacterium]